MNLVPRAGIEPARPFSRQILSLLCLPIPPPGLKSYKLSHIERAMTILISAIKPKYMNNKYKSIIATPTKHYNECASVYALNTSNSVTLILSVNALTLQITGLSAFT